VGVDETRDVFERENTDGAVWTPTGEDYDELLWHFVVEAVFGGDIGAGANNVDADGFQRLATAWAPIDVRPLRWPGPDHCLWGVRCRADVCAGGGLEGSQRRLVSLWCLVCLPVHSISRLSTRAS
jgi:hypothetical protein